MALFQQWDYGLDHRLNPYFEKRSGPLCTYHGRQETQGAHPEGFNLTLLDGCVKEILASISVKLGKGLKLRLDTLCAESRLPNENFVPEVWAYSGNINYTVFIRLPPCKYDTIMVNVPTAILILNILSLVGAGVMMAMVVWLRFTRPEVANTISFRLSFWIGLVDVLYRGSYLLRKSYDLLDPFLPTNVWAARIILWTIYVFPLWFAFLTTAIAFDLHLTFIYRRTDVTKFQVWYFPLSTISSVIITIPILIVGNLHWDLEKHAVLYNWDLPTGSMLEIFCQDLWLGITILYSFVVIISVLVRVRSDLKIIQQSCSPNSVRSPIVHDRPLIQSVLRILLYPVVLVICQPVTIVVNWLFFTGMAFSPLGYRMFEAEAVLNGMQGLLNFVVFLLNPAVVRTIGLHNLFRRRGEDEKQ
ncbi:uncharacterized protein VTP21DRAFT_2661 [Calcarisporiella thermophila]|uniref:uncharacterized protein n=1 Tax=Calcarisporiella thermophila TaxID=911321 RepID=UPI003743586D